METPILSLNTALSVFFFSYNDDALIALRVDATSVQEQQY